MLSLAVMYLAFFGVFVLSGLFAVYVSTRTSHWFPRAIVLIASVLPLLLVDANDLMLILLVSQLVIFAGVAYETFRQKVISQADDVGQKRLFVFPRFSLFDLMLLIFVACVLVAVLSKSIQMSLLEFIQYVGIGCSIGTWTLLGVGLFYWKFPLRKKLLVFFIFAVVTAIWLSLDNQWLINGAGKLQQIIAWVLFLTVNAGAVALAVFLFRFGTARPDPAGDANGSKSLRAMRFGGLTFLAAGGIVLAGATFFCFGRLLFPPPIATNIRPVVPGEPNGFADFMEAGQKFSQSPILSMSLPTNPGVQMQTEISNFSSAFEQVESGLAKPNQTWIEWSSDDWRRSDILNLAMPSSLDIAVFRTVARALTLKATQERADGNYDDALQTGIQIVRVSQSTSGDGVLLTCLLGTACEQIGHLAIQNSLRDASREKLVEAGRIMEEIETTAPDVDRIVANEKYYMWQLADWKARLFYAAVSDQMLLPAIEQTERVMSRRKARVALVRTSIAIEIYRRDFGVYPPELSQLDSSFKQECCLDPFSKSLEPLRYACLKNGQQYRLYSVGEDGVDDKGAVNPKSNFSKGDWDFSEIARLQAAEFKSQADEIVEAEAEN